MNEKIQADTESKEKYQCLISETIPLERFELIEKIKLFKEQKEDLKKIICVELVLGIVDVLALETTTVATTLLSKLSRIQRSRVRQGAKPMRECIQHLKDKIGVGVTRVFIIGSEDIHTHNNKNNPNNVKKKTYNRVSVPSFRERVATIVNRRFTTKPNRVYIGGPLIQRR